METNETEQPQPVPAALPAESELQLSPEAQLYLRETGKWASFLSVMGFIFCGLILLIALFIGTFFSFMSKISPVYGSFSSSAGGFISVFYILLDVLYFFFPFYLYRFADRTKKGMIFKDSMTITDALKNLKSFFKLWGIVTIVLVGLYALIFIFAIIVGVGASALSH